MIIGNSTILPIDLAASIATHARSVGLLRVSSDTGSDLQALATAFLVDKDLVLTAGYVVGDRNDGGWELADRHYTVDFDFVPDKERNSASRSFLDAAPYPWVEAEAGELHSLLADAYTSSDARFHVLAVAGIPRQHLLQEGTPYATWRQALDVAASMSLTRKLLQTVLEDSSVSGFHPRIRELLPVEAPIEASVVAASESLIGWAALRLAAPVTRPPLGLRAEMSDLVGGGVIIVQHPQGGFKRFVLEPEGIVGVTDDMVQYEADTEPGAGGAPIFDTAMRVIGIHHRSDRQRGINEGIRIDVVKAGLQEHGLSFVGAASPA